MGNSLSCTFFFTQVCIVLQSFACFIYNVSHHYFNLTVLMCYFSVGNETKRSNSSSGSACSNQTLSSTGSSELYQRNKDLVTDAIDVDHSRSSSRSSTVSGYASSTHENVPSILKTGTTQPKPDTVTAAPNVSFLHKLSVEDLASSALQESKSSISPSSSQSGSQECLLNDSLGPPVDRSLKHRTRQSTGDSGIDIAHESEKGEGRLERPSQTDRGDGRFERPYQAEREDGRFERLSQKERVEGRLERPSKQETEERKLGATYQREKQERAVQQGIFQKGHYRSTSGTCLPSPPDVKVEEIRLSPEEQLPSPPEEIKVRSVPLVLIYLLQHLCSFFPTLRATPNTLNLPISERHMWS